MNRKILITGLKNEGRETKNLKAIADIRSKAITDAGIASADADVPLESILNETDAEIDHLIAENKQDLQTESYKQKVGNSEVHLKIRETEIAEQREPLKKQIKGILADIERTTQNLSMKKVKLVMLVLLIICGTDALINMRSFQLLTDNLLVAILVAILTVGALALSAHIVGKKIREAETKAKQILWFSIGIAGGAVIFFLLGVMRQAFYGDTESWMASPILWTIWNLFFYACAILISALYLPTRKEWADHEAYMILKDKLAAVQKQDKELENELRRLQQEHAQLEQDTIDLVAYEKGLIERLEKQRAVIHATAQKEYTIKGGKLNSTRSLSEPLKLNP